MRSIDKTRLTGQAACKKIPDTHGLGTCADVGFGWLLNTGAVCGILRGAVPAEACLNSEVGVRRKGLMFLLRLEKCPLMPCGGSSASA